MGDQGWTFQGGWCNYLVEELQSYQTVETAVLRSILFCSNVLRLAVTWYYYCAHFIDTAQDPGFSGLSDPKAHPSNVTWSSLFCETEEVNNESSSVKRTEGQRPRGGPDLRSRDSSKNSNPTMCNYLCDSLAFVELSAISNKGKGLWIPTGNKLCESNYEGNKSPLPQFASTRGYAVLQNTATCELQKGEEKKKKDFWTTSLYKIPKAILGTKNVFTFGAMTQDQTLSSDSHLPQPGNKALWSLLCSISGWKPRDLKVVLCFTLMLPEEPLQKLRALSLTKKGLS
ncbi:uncharacterized protein LOC115941631 [Leptonychotes weddellii]|uniref:Uncharacterized protein LOC115941631 n=1 Tax=Leptonychotes weddellii TaxID=9713 RepID=A0A7F8QYP7_LEPWE|nr:uncharacterized protein LOC115941631 [Leptonychotes weddellii]